MHLRPLAATFLVTDPMFPLFHSPTSKRKRRHSWKNSRMPPHLLIELPFANEGKKILRKKWERFPQWE
jgi:hypothetical protein